MVSVDDDPYDPNFDIAGPPPRLGPGRLGGAVNATGPGAGRQSGRQIKKPRKDLPDEDPQHSQKGKVKGKLPAALKYCNSILKELFAKKHAGYAWPFYKPVDAKLLGLHDYHDIIKKPMDLGTVKMKMESHAYQSATDFAEDVRVIFTNCYRYNPPESDVVMMAKKLQVFYLSY